MNPVQPHGSKADLAAPFPGCLIVWIDWSLTRTGYGLSGLPDPAPYLSLRGGGLAVGRPAGLSESPATVVSRSLAAGDAGQGWVLEANYILPPVAAVVTASGSCKEALGSSLLCLPAPAVPTDWLFVVTSLVLSHCPAGPPLLSSGFSLEGQ